MRAYLPLEETGLCFRFAATEATMAGVLGFANEYGILGCDVTQAIQFTVIQSPAPCRAVRRTAQQMDQ